MRGLGWLLIAAVLIAGGWWWFTREQPRRQAEAARRAQAEVARAEQAASLYRWRDERGVLQITERPPRGRRFERIDRTAREGIEVHGDRE